MRKYRRVTFEDRCLLKAYLESRLTASEIERLMNFHKSTIARELRRNSVGGRYVARGAQELARARFESCRRRIKLLGASLSLVRSKLEEGWSPEQISGRLRREKVLSISHEAIYRAIRADKQGGGRLFVLLRRPVKRAQSRYFCRFKQAEGLLNIRQRETIVNRRERLGDWERDTIYGGSGRFLLVIVDRKTRYMKLGKPEGRKSSEIGQLTLELLRNKPVRTLTNDNGSEFKDHYMFNCPVYYCDPHKPQQRGSVENTVGLLRQYVTRQTDLTRLSNSDIVNLERLMNNRPRKCLDYQTPNEVWSEELVALAV